MSERGTVPVDDAGTDASGTHEHLRGKLSVLQIAIVTIAFSAPLAVVAGYLGVVIALGNGLGAPVAFLFTGTILLIFAAGYIELVKKVPVCGGFYVYITAGLGRPFGLAGMLLAIVSYFLLAAGTYTLLGLSASRFVAMQLPAAIIPWWVFAGAAWVFSALLSYRELDTSAKVMGVSIVLEFALMLSFNVHVVTTGGPEGFSLHPFALSSIGSGSIGLALLFSMGMFFGFESTAVYRDEARDPAKTIPRATFLCVAFMTLFYSVTTYLLITAMGSSKAVAIATQDPAGVFTTTLRATLGKLPTDAAYLLLCTSLYGAVLSMHNVLSRYVFKLATNGLIASSLGHMHPKHNAPSRASLVASLGIFFLIAPFALFDQHPDMLYIRLTGVATFGIIFLIFVTSIAVVVYFARNRTDLGIFRTRVAPVIAATGLLAIVILANLNFVSLVGTSQAIANIILAGVYLVVIAGVGGALHLRRKRPLVYANIGYD